MAHEAGIEVDPDGPATDWYLARDVVPFIELAERRCGDPELGRRTGEEMLRSTPEVISFLHASGSVREALRLSINLGSRTRTQPSFQIIDEGPNHMVVRSTATRSSRFACGISAGNWAQVPSLFGAVGTVVEPSCVTRGDPYCEFRVAWDEEADRDLEAVERSRRRGDTMVSRFEELQSLAAELAAESTVGGLLDKIADRARSAVLAPSVVVAVRLADGDRLHIGWSGLDETRAREVGHSLDMGAYAADPSVGVAPIESPRRHYGHLAVIAQPGSHLSRQETRMLNAYASHATAAIEAAAALDEARAERDTAEALLGLARHLAEVASTREIAQRIAEAVPSVVRSNLAAVMVLDPEQRTLEVVGSWPDPVEQLRFDAVELDDVPLARTVVDDQTPAFVRTEDTDGLLRSLLRATGAACVGGAPIVIRGEVAGIVLAACTEEFASVDVETILHRLGGLADHAATALDNSHLLERIRHQALHDPLTGLANRALIEDRVEHALAMAERVERSITLLFLDLDRFKAINDELGHAAGDALLCQLARRMQGCVRASDTVSRLGGDEFLILLENTDGDEDGVRVADKLIRALSEPVELAGRSVRVSASIGITSAPGRSSGYDELVTRADQAMYEVKNQGRNGWSVFAPITGT